MGLSPAEVNRLSVWQFLTAIDGYAEAHNPEGDVGLSEAEKDDLWAMVSAS